jgi:hypothetical protein
MTRALRISATIIAAIGLTAIAAVIYPVAVCWGRRG